ncbi:ethanolamine ammonia-lyase subunit EutB [Granulosicoccaceae sp. 1_MG-2023]|nr:ethanolamine ammonia-lyase subunit EutB [Granulosicoccaceae sp. 1_MG-2023]
MYKLKDPDSIPVPEFKRSGPYTVRLLDRQFSFRDLNHLLGAADFSKAGDRGAGLSASGEVEREAARSVLSGLTLQHLYDHPPCDGQGRIDSVMRVNYDIDLSVFAGIAALSLGELKDLCLRSPAARLREIGSAMTGVMVAALTKLLDVHELILLAKRLKQGADTRARTRLGLPGTLSSRLQPNHPTDDPDAMTRLIHTGLSMGSGDALIGLNPAIDTVESISRALHHIDQVRRETGAPTQICVLAHIKTQLACLQRGAPVEILFQSLAGTEATLTGEFDVTVALLDEAYEVIHRDGPLAGEGANLMYFETGQGSEYSYAKHNNLDMTCCEALCYGLARRYRPFMVNNVTGFIGPETHLNNTEMTLANLQDHFMGKFMGLAMGMAPCFTLHSEVTIEGQQMATGLLTAAGANFFMDVYLGIDRMLAYFDTSGHDDQTLREVHGLRTAPEYEDWAVSRGIFVRDEDGGVQRRPNWGNPDIFAPSALAAKRLQEAVPAHYGADNAGPRPANAVTRLARINQAIAREAIYTDLRAGEFAGLDLRRADTAARSKAEHLADPELGARLSADAAAALAAEHRDVQIVVSDGLSAEAVHHNLHELLPVLQDGLDSRGYTRGRTLLAPCGRVKLAESVGELLRPRLVIMLIGERPGGDALASRSLSAYLAYRLERGEEQQAAAAVSGNPAIAYEYSVISNIYPSGLPPAEAGSVIAEKAMQILERGAAGNRLEQVLAGAPA